MDPQNFANHTRWHPTFHFFVLPVMLINFSGRWWRLLRLLAGIQVGGS